MASATLEELERKVSADPRNADLRHLLEAQYAEEEQFELAARELLQAITLNPAADTARFQLGLLHLTRGDVNQAFSTWDPLELLVGGAPLKSFKQGLEALARNDFVACDMRKVLERLLKGPDAVQAAGNKVRTDFSLYIPSRH